jgi:hypothetical protein
MEWSSLTESAYCLARDYCLVVLSVVMGAVIVVEMVKGVMLVRAGKESGYVK